MNLIIAYFDPSAGSLVLQALVGGFGGIVVVGRYLWMQLVNSNPAPVALSQSQEIQIPVSNRAK